MTGEEKGLRHYLNKHEIYKGDYAMQTIIINSFYSQREQDNDDEWEYKIKYAASHFGMFAQYAQNNWKKNPQNPPKKQLDNPS